MKGHLFAQVISNKRKSTSQPSMGIYGNKGNVSTDW